MFAPKEATKLKVILCFETSKISPRKTFCGGVWLINIVIIYVTKVDSDSDCFAALYS